MNLTRGLKAEAAQRSARHPHQRHIGFLGGAVALAHIAAQTSRGDVFPGIPAPPATGHHMIDRQRLITAAAVLTAVVVAVKQVAPRQRKLTKGHPHVLTQTDDGREMGATPNLTGGILLETLGLAFEHHHHGATPGGDVQRLVGRVENENLAHASSLNANHAIDLTKPPLVTLSTKAQCRS